MKNTFGNHLSITLMGESHGSHIGAVLDGMSPGLPISEEIIAHHLALRCPYGPFSTKRREADVCRIVSGVYQGRTTGTPITLLIENKDVKSDDYTPLAHTPRPSHADYTAECKYHGFQDPRGGGHFSGRVTAALVAAGSIAIQALATKGIKIGTHISRLGGVDDRAFDVYGDDITLLEQQTFPVLDDIQAQKMQAQIALAQKDGDSVGGILETVVTGMPAGIGEPWFDTVEGVLAHGLFSIPAIKGVEFGDGFGLADLKGSTANDGITLLGDEVLTESNHAGGVCGGVSNGMPIVFRCVVKPTPSIAKPQDSIDLLTRQKVQIEIAGRHDTAILPRARMVVDAITALTLADLLLIHFGADYFTPLAK